MGSWLRVQVLGGESKPGHGPGGMKLVDANHAMVSPCESWPPPRSAGHDPEFFPRKMVPAAGRGHRYTGCINQALFICKSAALRPGRRLGVRASTSETFKLSSLTSSVEISLEFSLLTSTARTEGIAGGLPLCKLPPHRLHEELILPPTWHLPLAHRNTNSRHNRLRSAHNVVPRETGL